ncbi:transcriptional regulator, HxlR family [Marinactinospora thermotolerans DSM 45154]|uniref:Transcriptional regulator, HxlR family n=1 Tax=Marinactinospora thermotolerans DSM 45154 TaxID=1122192 RepID=A0A1T4RNU9_9ACTN|nr:helix-turn-helix domain-containing protein [Marinactinospora thermotolerans]SKA17428.1 transcriptional regulator, HxlR family [Marinactinospora thermotolerans DSM 45154]
MRIMEAEARRPGDINDPDCPTRRLIDRVGDKWSVLVILRLFERTHRFSELRTAIGGVTPKVLTHTLRALERDGLVERHVYAEVPPRVEYRLTGLGHSIVAPLAALRDWAEEHIPQVVQARERYDAAHAKGPEGE